MDDLISRQAAIEVIDAVMPVDPNKSEYASGIACGAALAMAYVKQLPPAQPEISCSETPNTSDTISRQAAIEAADKIIERDTSGNNAVVNAMIAWSEYIKTLPPAYPEIIYCKDCKHRTFHDNSISSEQCYVCDYWDFDDPQPNGFCNFAERCEK